MSGGLKMPGKGRAAQLLSELNAEHAPLIPTEEQSAAPYETNAETNNATNVTTLQETFIRTNDQTNKDSIEVTPEEAFLRTAVSTNAGHIEDYNESPMLPEGRILPPVSGPASASSKEEGKSARLRRGVGKSAAGSAAPGGSGRLVEDREQRFSRALAIAYDDEISVVTVRVSGKLNKYLDDYVDRINRIDPKRKYRKQDAIAEAFAAFYADHVMPPAPVEDEL